MSSTIYKTDWCCGVVCSLDNGRTFKQKGNSMISRDVDQPIHNCDATKAESGSTQIGFNNVASMSTSLTPRSSQCSPILPRLSPPCNGFQRRVLFLLVSIQKKLDETGRHLEPAESPFHLKQCADQIDFMELEAQLKDETNRRAVPTVIMSHNYDVLFLFVHEQCAPIFPHLITSMRHIFLYRISILHLPICISFNLTINIGGADPKDAVRKILKRMMSNQLMASMNLKGKDSKSAFDSTLLFAVLKGAVMKRHDVTKTDILMVTASCLKYAPDRSGGGVFNSDDASPTCVGYCILENYNGSIYPGEIQDMEFAVCL
ncbi:hypothetical protein CAPTEDRAFT_217626 [Capitella teleta]|uniref:Uncharacterized protein n=1 Tax=Capitella teleta TaxID=283909 RepID=R7TUY2_CAPTE|nr:hypothetical protein CAPTEDRAFT_217626 [Capitella teleta]|eukprot:ELT95281.1 hypothetical protein CAPTEDRAFT_217626 [Capitella teleta]